MYKIGLSASKSFDESYFKECELAGIGAMEISCNTSGYEALDFEAVKKRADAHNVELWSLHLPFDSEEKANPSSPDKQVRDSTIAYFSGIIKKATEIGIKIFVVHANCSEPVEEDSKRKLRIAYAKETLDALARVADSFGAVIAVENLPRTCLGRNSDEILELTGANSKLKICYDTNHLLEQDAVEFIKAVGDKIITIHVSDYDFVNERHWLPGEGKNDWQGIIKALKEIGYSGVWMYEIGFECPVTIIRDRNLNCNDFVKNANELFENKPITTFSVHKENLGMWE